MCTSCISPELDYSELRGRIKAKIGTEGEFARLINRTPQFVSSVFNGNTYFSVTDIVNICDVLEVETELIGFLFYTLKVHKCEN